jgi:hypothetical protein
VSNTTPPKDYLSDKPTQTLFWVELVCANCSTTTAGEWTAGRLNIKQMKDQAVKEGWSFGGKQAFCSQDCRTRYIERFPPPLPEST